MLKAWIDESYRAQAPKKPVRVLDGGAAAPAKRASANARRTKKAPAKKSTKTRAR